MASKWLRMLMKISRKMVNTSHLPLAIRFFILKTIPPLNSLLKIFRRATCGSRWTNLLTKSKAKILCLESELDIRF